MKTNMKYIDSLNGREFEKFVYKIFNTDPRYTAKLTPASHDFGLDVIAADKYHPEHHQHTYHSTGCPQDDFKISQYRKRTYGIQCKHTNGTAIGYKAVEEAISGIKYYKIPKAIVLTNGLFTTHAEARAKRTGVRLINRDGLRQLIKNYYKDIYKHMINTSIEKDTLTLDKNLTLDAKAMAKTLTNNDYSLILFTALDNYYHTKLTHKQKIKVLSIYDKLLCNIISKNQRIYYFMTHYCTMPK